MIRRQEEEAEWQRQNEINELNLLHKFAEASFEEACFNRLNNVLQPVIHMRWERNHCQHQWMSSSPLVLPSDSSSLPSPLQRPRRPSIPSPIASHSSDLLNHSTPQALVGSFHNPIVIDNDDYDNDTTFPADNTRCSRCQWYIYNSFHSKEYCNTIFVPGASAMVCRQCGLHGHLMLDCREIVCSWCGRLGHIINNCPSLGWTFRIWNFRR